MKTRTLLCLVLLATAVAGCKKDDDQEPVQTGSITGKIVLTDEFGNTVAEQSDMTISVPGKSSGESDSNGEFRIDNLPSGSFNLDYEKDGFGVFKKFGIQVVAGASATVLNGIDYLGQKSTTEIDSLTVTSNGSTFNIGCNIFPVPTSSTPRPFRLFFGKNSFVSSSDYQFAPTNTWIATTGSGAILNYDPVVLYSNGFVSGETVYVIAYGDSKNANSYTDPSTNKKVYPNVNAAGASNVVDFILP